MIRLDELLRSPPAFHTHEGGLTADWRLADAELQFLDSQLQPGMKTLETGAGVSTVLFGVKGTDHTCITLDEDLVSRIRSFLEERSVPHEQIRFLIGRSEYILPELQERHYDLALIDGRHGFPTPFMDWFYMASALRREGMLMIDDLHIWTADLLKRFLEAEPGWKLVRETSRAATFVKLADGAQWKEWIEQPYVRRRSLRGSVPATVRYLLRSVRVRDLSPFRRVLRGFITS